MSVAISIRGIVCGPSNYPINQEILSIVIKKLHFGHVFIVLRRAGHDQTVAVSVN